MTVDIFWSEEAAAVLRAWADEHTPRFVAHVVDWAEQELPIQDRENAINDIVTAEFLRNGYAELCPCGQKFRVVPATAVADITVH